MGRRLFEAGGIKVASFKERMLRSLKAKWISISLNMTRVAQAVWILLIFSGHTVKAAENNAEPHFSPQYVTPLIHHLNKQPLEPNRVRVIYLDEKTFVFQTASGFYKVSDVTDRIRDEEEHGETHWASEVERIDLSSWYSPGVEYDKKIWLGAGEIETDTALAIDEEFQARTSETSKNRKISFSLNPLQLIRDSTLIRTYVPKPRQRVGPRLEDIRLVAENPRLHHLSRRDTIFFFPTLNILAASLHLLVLVPLFRAQPWPHIAVQGVHMALIGTVANFIFWKAIKGNEALHFDQDFFRRLKNNDKDLTFHKAFVATAIGPMTSFIFGLCTNLLVQLVR